VLALSSSQKDSGRSPRTTMRCRASWQSCKEVRVMDLTPAEQKLMDEYTALSHAMQSGVAVLQNYDDPQTQPKHLRVGVNCAMVEHAALCELLFDKGVMTPTELLTYMIRKMHAEVESYRLKIAERLNCDPEKITLG